MKIIKYTSLVSLVFILFVSCSKPSDDISNNGSGTNTIVDEEIVSPPNSLFQTVVPKKIFDIITVKPTTNSVTLSILGYKTTDATIEYNNPIGSITNKISIKLAANIPQEVLIKNLEPGTTYEYTLAYKVLSNNESGQTIKQTFCTAKIPGSSFSFAVLADSHLDMLTDTSIYNRTLSNILESKNDFMIDLGDTFMDDKYGKDFSMSLYNYLAQRYYFGSISSSITYYFVQGNHDGELGFYNDGTSQSWANWANTTRKKYFPMPEPNEFYGGNTQKDPFNGSLQDYYSWEWGNTLFIVLDPFWYTMPNGSQEPWNRTLGLNQYNWLKTTLEKSTAKFKFVFLHNLVGGVDIDGKARGGAEVVGLYEWGGKSPDGQNLFAEKRPNWEMPIHDLLKKHGVNAVFHGHDHFYGYQQVDGIIYQEVPQPGSPEDIKPNQAAQYGYKQGTILGGTGYLQFTVNPTSVLVQYIGTSIKNPSANKTVKHLYSIN